MSGRSTASHATEERAQETGSALTSSAPHVTLWVGSLAVAPQRPAAQAPPERAVHVPDPRTHRGNQAARSSNSKPRGVEGDVPGRGLRLDDPAYPSQPVNVPQHPPQRQRPARPPVDHRLDPWSRPIRATSMVTAKGSTPRARSDPTSDRRISSSPRLSDPNQQQGRSADSPRAHEPSLRSPASTPGLCRPTAPPAYAATLAPPAGAIAQPAGAPRSHRGGQGFESPDLYRQQSRRTASPPEMA